MAPPAFGESLAQLDAIIAKLEGGGGASAAPAALPQAPEAPAPAPAAAEKKKPKKAPAPQPKKKKGNAPAGPQPLFTKLDLRVGKIVKVWEHPDSEKLWCEEIDVGEEKPRQIVSGLRAWYTKEQMLGKRLIAVCNLKTAKLGGVPSAGMVMCAQTPKVRSCDQSTNNTRLRANQQSWHSSVGPRGVVLTRAYCKWHNAAGRRRQADRSRVH